MLVNSKNTYSHSHSSSIPEVNSPRRLDRLRQPVHDLLFPQFGHARGQPGAKTGPQLCELGTRPAARFEVLEGCKRPPQLRGVHPALGALVLNHHRRHTTHRQRLDVLIVGQAVRNLERDILRRASLHQTLRAKGCHRAHLIGQPHVVGSDDESDERLHPDGFVAEKALIVELVVDVHTRRRGFEHRVRVVPTHNLHVLRLNLRFELNLRDRVHLHVHAARHAATGEGAFDGQRLGVGVP
mmetsp:Transcript_8570/g.38893  ORF Transcript_8570/g.38893 Transcript_8570/m.38893 type:complete len:240 (+) Transcript_8570:1624-2343(+)